MIKKVMDERLDVSTRVREEKCQGLDGCCAFRIDLGKKRVKKG